MKVLVPGPSGLCRQIAVCLVVAWIVGAIAQLTVSPAVADAGPNGTGRLAEPQQVTPEPNRPAGSTVVGDEQRGAPSAGAIAGCITDPWVGILPGVEVSIVGADARRRAVSDRNGCFEFLQLPPSQYSLEASLQAFATERRDRIDVQAGSITWLDLSLSLAPGAIAEPPLRNTLPPGISGRVTDTSGAALPGVEVVAFTVTGVQAVRAITDGQGRYHLAVGAGRYAIGAKLAGFCRVRREGVDVRAGYGTLLDISLSVGRWDGASPPMTLGELWSHADAVARVRVESSSRGDTRPLIHELSVIETHKWDPIDGAGVRRLRCLGDRRFPLKVGREYVVFLNAAGALWQIVAGPVTAFPISDGKIGGGGCDVVASRNGLSLEQFRAELHVLASARQLEPSLARAVLEAAMDTTAATGRKPTILVEPDLLPLVARSLIGRRPVASTRMFGELSDLPVPGGYFLVQSLVIAEDGALIEGVLGSTASGPAAASKNCRGTSFSLLLRREGLGWVVGWVHQKSC